ncbi:hypothetical protein FA95DRAFT_672410 [Auriscalpium vulgare]|uniref:Uncharacterized protein n=1 Tax=Auriscalpium vulgare TaxID=40419 RepID=A0ACB8RDR5_9AGAM|nr:hypothetical protein FA95DRAFT_672410 [Auriscalpium vulgare]
MVSALASTACGTHGAGRPRGRLPSLLPRQDSCQAPEVREFGNDAECLSMQGACSQLSCQLHTDNPIQASRLWVARRTRALPPLQNTQASLVGDLPMFERQLLVSVKVICGSGQIGRDRTGAYLRYPTFILLGLPCRPAEAAVRWAITSLHTGALGAQCGVSPRRLYPIGSVGLPKDQAACRACSGPLCHRRRSAAMQA